MATTIVTKSGSGAPTASDLVAGELAVDLTNKRLYTEDSGGTVLELGTNPASDVTFGDNTKAVFGAGSDLQIYHNAGTSFITESGSGNFKIGGENLYLQNTAHNENYLAAIANQGVTLYYNNVEKLATTTTGIDVTGTVTADGLTSSGDLSVTGVATIGADAGGEANILTIKGRTSDNDAYIKFTSSDGATSYAYAGVSSANTLAFYTNGFTKRLDIGSGGDISFYEDTGTTPKFFWDASAESLGIGTSSPESGLHLFDGTNVRAPQNANRKATLTIEAGSEGSADIQMLNASYNHIFFGDAADANVGYFLYDHTNNSMQFATNAEERMRIDASGFVGIGTAPSSALHVKDSSEFLVNVAGNDSSTEFKSSLGNSWRIGNDSSLNAFAITQSASLTTDVRLFIANGGNVGIGTASPAAKLHIENGDMRIEKDTKATIGFRGHTTGSTALAFRDSSAAVDRMTIDASGNLLVGTTSAGIGDAGIELRADGQITGTRDGNYVALLNRLTSDGTIVDLRKDGTTVGSIGVDSNSYLVIKSEPNGSALILEGSDNSGTTTRLAMQNASGSEAFRPFNLHSDALFDLGSSARRFKDLYLSGVAYAGELIVGNTVVPSASSGGAAFDPNTNGRAILKLGTTSTANQGLAEFFNPNGQVGGITTNGSATAYNTSSDQRLKENIADADGAGSKIDSIQVRKFDWKADGSHQDYGMVAQELLEVAPEAVSAPEDPEEMMGVDYSKLVPMMLKEIQSLRARVAQLES